MNIRDMPKVCLVVLAYLCTICICQKTSETDRQIRVVRDSVIRIDRALIKMEDGQSECNDTMVEISGRLKSVNKRVEKLYTGPLFATVNIKKGFRDYNNVLLVLPDPVEICIENYKGTQVSNAQAIITCIQQIFWRYEPPEEPQKIETEKQVVVAFASIGKDKIKKPQTMPPPPTEVTYPVTTLRGQTPPEESSGAETAGTTTAAYVTSQAMMSSAASMAASSMSMASSSAASSAAQFATPTTTATEPPAHPTIKKIRPEYRTLTFEQRTRFHDAMNALYKDGTIAAFSALHNAATEGAYNGPGFYPWHRLFLNAFEDALQAVDPTVTLPYWDSTIDNCMDNPVKSILWTPGFLGNGAGRVVVGPFANWVTEQGFIERAYGTNSRLISREQVNDFLSRCRYEEISFPKGERRYRLETYQGNVKAWVGGELDGMRTASFDPLFYLHHCFIDYLWEKFRIKQKTVCGRDPETDYVDVEGAHNFNMPMDQINVYNNSEGLLNVWSDIVEYVDSPTCENNCGGSDVLYCNVTQGCCVPVSKFDVPWDALSSTSTRPLPADNGNGPESSERCEWFFDPNCFYLRIANMERRGAYEPLTATEELEIIDNMMPRNRGQLFSTNADDNDGRSLLSAAIEEGYEGLV